MARSASICFQLWQFLNENILVTGTVVKKFVQLTCLRYSSVAKKYNRIAEQKQSDP